MTDKDYLVAISNYKYFGPVRLKLLISYFKTAKKIWTCSYVELSKLGLPPKKVLEFIDFRKTFNIGSYLSRLEKLRIKVVTFLDDDFPKALKDLEDAPVVLYFKGSLKGLSNSTVAIVGTRKMTSYGREVTEKFSSELASFGVTIVSGLAHGVDTAAHTACVRAGGITVAVLGTGLDQIYPSENIRLASEIIKTGGAIISEYPLGYPALPENFAIRNRIVSGLSTCLLVIEGAEKSGTLLTASHAADQGKTVFAIPGQIYSPLSKAPLFLLKNGARIATETKDILDELNITVKVDKEKMRKIAPDSPEEAKIIDILSRESLYLDELVRISGSKTSEISARLTIMEMKGLVRNIGGKYSKT